MKKKYFLIFLVTFLISCEKENDENSNLTVGELLCLSTWNLAYYYYDNGDTITMPTSDLNYIHYIFKDDSTLRMEEQLPKYNNMIVSFNYNWSLTGTTLVLTGGQIFQYNISKIDRQTLELKFKNDLNNITYVYNSLK